MRSAPEGVLAMSCLSKRNIPQRDAPLRNATKKGALIIEAVSKGSAIRRAAKTRHLGLSLLEMLTALAIGLGLIIVLIRLLVSGLSGQQIQSQLQLRQENSRYFLSRLRHDIQQTGYYEPRTIAPTPAVDVNNELAFVQSHPILLPGDLPFDVSVGTQPRSNGSDELMVAFQSDRDCRGFKLGYGSDEQFFVVNRYFVQGSTLYCVGFDGRVLLQQKAAEGHNRHSRAALLEQVYEFQVRFMLVEDALSEEGAALTQTRFVDSEALIQHPEWVRLVRAIHLGCILRAQLPRINDEPPTLFFMGELRHLPVDVYRYATVETLIPLRNSNQTVHQITLDSL